VSAVLAVVDLFAGLVFLAVAVTSARGSQRYAALCAAVGLAWLAAPLDNVLLLLHRPLLLHAALAYPSGRLPGWGPRLLVAVAWAGALLPGSGQHPGAMLLLGVLLAAGAWSAAAQATWARRDVTRTSVAATTVLALSLVLPAGARLVWGSSAATQLLTGLYSGLVLLAGVILLAGLLHRSPRRETDAVIELSEETGGEVLTALRTEVESRSSPADRSALLAAAELLESNARLQAGLSRGVEEVRASRSRLVAAAVTERRRLGQSLDAGARRYLDELRGILAALGSGADEEVVRMVRACCTELDRTQEDLDQLAQGLHPRLLAEEGLDTALVDLGTRCPVPVDVRVRVGRLPEQIETAVWYACAEALTNVVKHAEATRAAIDVTVTTGEVTARVDDDGIGGARPVPGGGIAGLADRLSVVGGDVTVHPSPDGGTQVNIRVPVP
jgi:signal transduction histidine kinase